jgi:hypothetical protein
MSTTTYTYRDPDRDPDRVEVHVSWRDVARAAGVAHERWRYGRSATGSEAMWPDVARVLVPSRIDPAWRTDSVDALIESGRLHCTPQAAALARALERQLYRITPGQPGYPQMTVYVDGDFCEVTPTGPKPVEPPARPDLPAGWAAQGVGGHMSLRARIGDWACKVTQRTDHMSPLWVLEARNTATHRLMCSPGFRSWERAVEWAHERIGASV